MNRISADQVKLKLSKTGQVPITSPMYIVFARVDHLSFLKLFSFMTKRSHLSQKMMRARVLAQGVTVLALLGGVVINLKQKREKQDKAVV